MGEHAGRAVAIPPHHQLRTEFLFGFLRNFQHCGDAMLAHRQQPAAMRANRRSAGHRCLCKRYDVRAVFVGRVRSGGDHGQVACCVVCSETVPCAAHQLNLDFRGGMRGGCIEQGDVAISGVQADDAHGFSNGFWWFCIFAWKRLPVWILL